MSRQIPWARVLVEGAVIVVSILMAFGIDAWWTETQERAEEQVLLSGLIEDLRQDSMDYAQVAAQHHTRVLAASYLLAQVGDPRASQEEAREAEDSGMTSGRAVGNLAIATQIETATVAYDQITAAGMSRVVSDPSLRIGIARYYALVWDRSDINVVTSRASQTFADDLRALGYAISDGESIPVDVVLSSPATRATLLNTRMSSGSASRSGAQLFEEAVALMRRIEVNLRPGEEL